MLKRLTATLTGVALLTTIQAQKLDESTIERNVDKLLAQMTTSEKVDQLMNDTPVNSRLKIPLMRHGECLHGIGANGATSFPQAIALGSTWDPELIERVSTTIAKEARMAGVTHCYTPNLDVIMGDPRYGRVEESYGEDPYLVSRIGVAFISGLQGRGDERFDENHIIATAKHFVGYPENRRGINGGFVDVSERRLREIHFPSFEAAVKEAKVGSLMPAHNDLNGIPCHMNSWLINDILRGEWGFDGFIVSDNVDVGRLQTMHHVAERRVDAAIFALRAGVDQELLIGRNKSLANGAYLQSILLDTLDQNPELMRYVDQSVKRVLTAKYRLNLFDAPSKRGTVESTQAAQDLALLTAEKSLILLKNENNTLPLNSSKIKSVAVIGPNAVEDLIEKGKIGQLGGYSGKPSYFVNVVEGLEAKGVKVNYAEGCTLLGDSTEGFAEAKAAALKSDVVVMVLGETRETCGEGVDTDDLRLTGMQEELFDMVNELGKPMVVVMLNGRPLDLNNVYNKSDALLEGWYLGMRTGDAIANVLLGEYNPGGKLTVTFPRNIGQLPATYLLRPDFVGSGRGLYRDSSKEPLFAFGYGLSYTTFEYSNLRLSRSNIKAGDDVKVSVDLKNTGKYDGDEVVQLYIRDNVASVGRYDKMLKAFDRVTLKSGESRTVEFDLKAKSFEMYDANLNRVIEPGDFTIYVGSSSRSDDLQVVNLRIEEK